MTTPSTPTDVLLEALREIRQRLWDPTLVVPGELARLVWDLRGIVAKAQAEHERRGREATKLPAEGNTGITPEWRR